MAATMEIKYVSMRVFQAEEVLNGGGPVIEDPARAKCTKGAETQVAAPLRGARLQCLIRNKP